MRHRCLTIGVMGVVGVTLGLAPRAAAQFGDLQRTLFRGSEFAGNRLFISNPQNGPLFDFNLFRQRIEFNRAAHGYTFDSIRFFGPDSFNNPNILDLGPLKIQMALDPALVASGQPAGIHNRIGFTTRLIPEVFFESQTGQRAFNVFSGIGSFTPVPLNYTVTFDTGVQKVEWSGNALIDAGGRVNALGFYDFQFRFVNVGDFEADGALLSDEQVTDFDVGPIDVSGNIFFDALAGLLQVGGATAAAVPPRIFSGAAQREITADDLLARLDAGHAVTDEEMQFLVQQMLTAAFVADPLGVITNGMPSEVPGFEGLALSMTATLEGDDTGGSAGAPTPTPEPGTLLLLVAAAGTFAAVRPLRRRRK